MISDYRSVYLRYDRSEIQAVTYRCRSAHGFVGSLVTCRRCSERKPCCKTAAPYRRKLSALIYDPRECVRVCRGSDAVYDNGPDRDFSRIWLVTGFTVYKACQKIPVPVLERYFRDVSPQHLCCLCDHGLFFRQLFPECGEIFLLRLQFRQGGQEFAISRFAEFVDADEAYLFSFALMSASTPSITRWSTPVSSRAL